MGPHSWGIRGLAQAQLLALWVLNTGWVLSCLSQSLPGTQTYVGTHARTHIQSAMWQTWTRPLLQAQKETEAREVVRHLVPLSQPRYLVVPLKKS